VAINTYLIRDTRIFSHELYKSRRIINILTLDYVCSILFRKYCLCVRVELTCLAGSVICPPGTWEERPPSHLACQAPGAGNPAWCRSQWNSGNTSMIQIIHFNTMEKTINTIIFIYQYFYYNYYCYYYLFIINFTNITILTTCIIITYFIVSCPIF